MQGSSVFASLELESPSAEQGSTRSWAPDANEQSVEVKEKPCVPDRRAGIDCDALQADLACMQRS